MDDPVTITFELHELEYIAAVMSNNGGLRMYPVRDDYEQVVRHRIVQRVIHAKQLLGIT